VTADGALLHASESENADLFLGLRGGGGNFGIVTSFEYRLHALGQGYGGLVAYPLPEAPQVMRGYAGLMAQASDDVLAGCFLLTTPDGHQAVGIAPAYFGDNFETGAKLLEPFRHLGTAVLDQVGPLPYTVLQELLDGAAVPGRRYYMRSNLLDQL